MPPSSGTIRFLESIVYGGRRDAAAVVIGAVLRALSGLYRAIIWSYLLPFKIGLRRRKRLNKPVISVGNIIIGGTGKTPVVLYLCRGLAARKRIPAVLSYGYGGQLGGRFGVVSDAGGLRLTPRVAGDEPHMLASTLPGVPVLVCKDRVRSGRVAIRALGADILVLDDGFQVWKLHRDLDIVLVNMDNPLDNGRTLPAGKLRESPHALRRADCIIAAGGGGPESRASALKQLLRAAPGVAVFFGQFEPCAVVSLEDGSERAVDALMGRRVLALSSIANPASFESMLAAVGARVAGVERFPDHHPYSREDVEYVNRRATESGAEMVATTEKDAVKLKCYRFDLPALALRISLELEDDREFWRLIEDRIGL